MPNAQNIMSPRLRDVLRYRVVHSSHDMSVYGHHDLMALVEQETAMLRARLPLYLVIGGAVVNNLDVPEWVQHFRSTDAEQRAGGLLGFYREVPVWSDVYETADQRVVSDWALEFCTLGPMPA